VQAHQLGSQYSLDIGHSERIDCQSRFLWNIPLVQTLLISMRTLLIAILASILLSTAQAGNPEEVGDVAWGRDYETALATAQETGKPIFLLFQEVPGCAGCKQFGNDVLSDTTVVESIESNFVPLLIHNNKGGEDARIRKMYREPAWNYQVVRFLDAKGKDIIPRKDRVWTTPELMARIETVLEKSSQASK